MGGERPLEVFKIIGTIALEGMEEFKRKTDEATGLGNKLSAKIGKGLATAAKVGAAAVGAAATAVGTLTKKSIDSFAEYEQLVGGAKLLFGDAYDYIAQKAETAYKDVQMSQNEYLQQANGLVTGLKTALGGNEQAAAELADRVIRAEADVVAATGNTQEAVQNAFNGIMKSNFTMLDNLQLGITPTKEGFQEVIDKVNEWNTANGKATDYQIDNLADCQSALVDYIAMQGLAGYAAAEAGSTIQGSLSMAKAAWENWLTALADDDADIKAKTDELIETVSAAAQKLVPVIGQVFTSLGEALQTKLPELFAKGAEFIVSNLPSIIALGFQLILALIQGLGQGFTQLLVMMDAWLQSSFVEPCQNKIAAFVDTASAGFENVKNKATEIFEGIKAAIQEKIDNAKQAVSDAIEQMKGFFDFEWSLPKIKLPHFSISGEFSLKPPSVPHFSVEWYKKGGILNDPTMFGFNPFTNSAMVGGEAGAEAIAPISTLKQYVSEAVRESGSAELKKILEILNDFRNGNLPVNISINLTTELDAAVIAKKTYKYNLLEQRNHGTSLINA